jgi:esterase
LAWKWDPRPRRAGFNAQRFAERRARLWEQVDRISCPTLVVRGRESDVFSAENAQTLATRLRDGRHVVVEGAGHTVQGDNPGGLVRELRGFLSGHGL